MDHGCPGVYQGVGPDCLEVAGDGLRSTNRATEAGGEGSDAQPKGKSQPKRKQKGGGRGQSGGRQGAQEAEEE